MQKLRADLIRFIRIKFYNLLEIEQEAEDIVNQTFLKACIKDYSELSFKHLAAMAVNEAIDRYRKLRHNTRLSEIDELPDENSLLDGDMTENRQLIDKALNCLNTEESRIIQLYYYEEINLVQISQRTGISLNTILSRHRRALQKMRSHLSNDI